MAEKKEYRIKVQGQLVPVSEEVYLTYHRMKRRETYLEERDTTNGVFYYSALDTEGTNSVELSTLITKKDLMSEAMGIALPLQQSGPYICAIKRNEGIPNQGGAKFGHDKARHQPRRYLLRRFKPCCGLRARRHPSRTYSAK
mgnify:CR=1 FL=1